MSISIVLPDGSMEPKMRELFAKAGLTIEVPQERTKEGHIRGVDWIKMVAFQRPQEIPIYVKEGYFDFAIVGEDWLYNWGYDFPVLLKLPIGRGGDKPVRIIVAVDENSSIDNVRQLPHQCQVASEYERLAERYFKSIGRDDIIVIPSFGNTEHKIRYGVEAIVDVTESGSSLKQNKLKVIGQIMESEMALIVNPKTYSHEKMRYIKCLVSLIQGAYQASKYVKLIANVPENVLQRAVALLGGLKGPSCTPILNSETWFALESIVEKEKETQIILALRELGVTDIIVERDLPLIMS